MKRWILIACIAASGFVMTTGTACSQKKTSVKSSERIEESEPEMVSPGEEVIE